MQAGATGGGASPRRLNEAIVGRGRKTWAHTDKGLEITKYLLL